MMSGTMWWSETNEPGYDSGQVERSGEKVRGNAGGGELLAQSNSDETPLPRQRGCSVGERPRERIRIPPVTAITVSQPSVRHVLQNNGVICSDSYRTNQRAE